MTLFTLSPVFLRGLACAVWLAVLITLAIRRPVWRASPRGMRLMLAGVAVLGAGFLIGAALTALHRVAFSPDRIAIETVGLIAGGFVLAGVLRYRPALPVPEAPPAVEAAFAASVEAEEAALEPLQPGSEAAATRLAAGLAHDFSNVLTVILTASEVLLMDETLPPPLRRRIERMHGAAERGADLTEQLRAFAGRLDLVEEVVDLHNLLRDSAVAFKTILGPAVELHYDLADGDCPVMLDAERMQAALRTVLTYYRGVLPDGGRVELGTRFLRLSRAEGAPPDTVVLAMTRSGVPLPLEDARRLLEQPYSAGTSSVAGGGFGLSLVASFVRQSGGQARFVGAPGGARPVLEIELPLVAPGPLAAGPDQPPPAP
mgnify:FL=1